MLGSCCSIVDVALQLPRGLGQWHAQHLLDLSCCDLLLSRTFRHIPWHHACGEAASCTAC